MNRLNRPRRNNLFGHHWSPDFIRRNCDRGSAGLRPAVSPACSRQDTVIHGERPDGGNPSWQVTDLRYGRPEVCATR